VAPYVSIDIETLGLDPDSCDVVEFGAVIDVDGITAVEQLPTFHRYILPPKRKIKGKDAFVFRGEPYAMWMHGKSEILKRIARKEEPYRYCIPKDLGREFCAWLVINGFEHKEHTDKKKQENYISTKVVVAGKNFQGFDMRFLRRLKDFEKHVKFNHRVHDPAALYFDKAKDAAPPGLEDCLYRAGIEKSVEHTAVADAQDVIRVLRHKWK
jgi:oligoribonuclease (3'-5' exoribonuclease)